MDFEQAQIKAFKQVFDDDIQGCFFHFRQVIVKYVRDVPVLFKKYIHDGSRKVKNMINQFVALAFVKPEHVVSGFESILPDLYLQKHENLFHKFIDYFECQWIVKR